MFHLVQSADGHSARRRHLVDGSLRVLAGGLKQLHGSLHGLQHYLLGILSLEAYLHSALYRSAYVAHGIGYAARGQGGPGCQQALLSDDGLAHEVEQLAYLRSLLGCGSHWHEEGHRSLVGYCYVGDSQEECGQRAVGFGKPGVYLLRPYTGCHDYEHLALVV